MLIQSTPSSFTIRNKNYCNDSMITNDSHLAMGENKETYHLLFLSESRKYEMSKIVCASEQYSHFGYSRKQLFLSLTTYAK